ncbi:MAG: OB-fold domain-containing protein [Chloroflexi bacterium]|nr:OB-fold domain-containing protein [Chloroflexota bacterium]
MQPAPTPDLESQPFWDALKGGRIVLQKCTACHRVRFPRMPACPYCGADGGTDFESTGRGEVYSWVRAHIALTPAMEAEVPYTVATIQLDDGPRLIGAVEAHGEVRIGDKVTPIFKHHETWTELRFQNA